MHCRAPDQISDARILEIAEIWAGLLDVEIPPLASDYEEHNCVGFSARTFRYNSEECLLGHTLPTISRTAVTACYRLLLCMATLLVLLGRFTIVLITDRIPLDHLAKPEQ